jgi:hypothetical protein
LIRGLFETHESAGACQFLYFSPEHARPLDVRLTFVAKAALSLWHRRRKDREQHIAIVRFAERVLQERKAFRDRLERRLAILEALERVAQTLARDAKVVQAVLIAVLETGCEVPYFTRAGFQHLARERGAPAAAT